MKSKENYSRRKSVMGRGGRICGEQQNTSDRHALWITLPGDPCAAKRHGNEQQHVSRRISRRRTEEANNYYTDIFCFMCDLNEYVYLTASRIFVFVTVRKGKVRTVSVERQHICRHHGGCVNQLCKLSWEDKTLLSGNTLLAQFLYSVESMDFFCDLSYLNYIFLLQDSASTLNKNLWNSLESRERHRSRHILLVSYRFMNL